MAHLGIRTRLAAGLAVAATIGGGAIPLAAPAAADEVAYLVNVTMRPGYNFADADHALAYGRGICDKVVSGRGYADIMADVKVDFANPDEFQASYLISQAANELCPAQIWQLRNSAAGYRPSAS